MFIIGIAGGTGSGKTTFVNKIAEGFSADEVIVVHQDSYYRDNSNTLPDQRKEINFDHPSAIEFTLMDDHITQLKNGLSVNQPVYSYLTCTRSEKVNRVDPARVMIIEGILIFTGPAIRNLMDLKIYLDADADERLSRVIYRDTLERGRTVENVLKRYEKTVKPMHLKYIEPTRKFADLIVPHGGNNPEAINAVRTIIEKKIQSSGKF